MLFLAKRSIKAKLIVLINEFIPSIFSNFTIFT